jgi:hypothetical protein
MGERARCKKARPDDGDHDDVDQRELHSDEVP